MVRTARSAPLFRRRRLPTLQAPPKQTVSPHLPPVSLSWRKSSKSNVMVWDFSGTTAVAVPYTLESSAHAARLEGIVTRIALRAKLGKQVGPSTTAGRFEATMFSPAVTVASASPPSLFSTASAAAAALPVQPSVRPEAATSSELACTPRGRVRRQGKVSRATVSVLPFYAFSSSDSFVCEPQFVPRWIPFYRV